ncbi:MAG TPA: T9SS type A sorting domain-containing protein, partial [Bacteroidales bacterium]
PSEYSGLIFDYSTGENPVSIKQAITNVNNYIHIFPNPATTSITLSSANPVSGVVQISNIYGQVIFKQQLTNVVKAEFNVSALKTDMYILRVIGNINYTTKIIKQ